MVEDFETTEWNVKNEYKSRYKKVWIWVLLAVIVVLTTIICNTDWWKQKLHDIFNQEYSEDKTISETIWEAKETDTFSIEEYEKEYNKAQEYRKNNKTLDELKEDVKNYETNTPEEEAFFADLWELINEFSIKINSIWTMFLELEDMKDVDKIEEAIENRKLYSETISRYSDEAYALFGKYKALDIQWDSKYSPRELCNEIKKLSDSVNVYADKYIDFYKYVMTIQDDFFVENETIYFYDGWDKLKEYNTRTKNLGADALEFAKDYNNYMEYLGKYNKYHWL